MNRSKPTGILEAKKIIAQLEAGETEMLPETFVKRMLDGESVLKLWREHRWLTQTALAEKSGVNRVQITNIESGKKTGSVATLKKLADALDVLVDDLV